jgi:hypothetical protein
MLASIYALAQTFGTEASWSADAADTSILAPFTFISHMGLVTQILAYMLARMHCVSFILSSSILQKQHNFVVHVFWYTRVREWIT